MIRIELSHSNISMTINTLDIFKHFCSKAAVVLLLLNQCSWLLPLYVGSVFGPGFAVLCLVSFLGFQSS